jgi:hypothetical protein
MGLVEHQALHRVARELPEQALLRERAVERRVEDDGDHAV